MFLVDKHRVSVSHEYVKGSASNLLVSLIEAYIPDSDIISKSGQISYLKVFSFCNLLPYL